MIVDVQSYLLTVIAWGVVIWWALLRLLGINLFASSWLERQLLLKVIVHVGLWAAAGALLFIYWPEVSP